MKQPFLLHTLSVNPIQKDPSLECENATSCSTEPGFKLLHIPIPDPSAFFLDLHDAVCSSMLSNQPLRITKSS